MQNKNRPVAHKQAGNRKAGKDRKQSIPGSVK